MSPVITLTGILDSKQLQDAVDSDAEEIFVVHFQIVFDAPVFVPWGRLMTFISGIFEKPLFDVDVEAAKYGVTQTMSGLFYYTGTKPVLALKAAPVSYGATCIICNERNEYTESRVDYVCWKHR